MSRVAVIPCIMVLCGLMMALLLSSSCASADPSVPVVSGTFYAAVEVTVSLPNAHIVRGRGYWAMDQPAGRHTEFFQATEDAHGHYSESVRNLFRYDLQRSYEIVDERTCHVRVENGSMPANWEWLQFAENEGNRTVDNNKVLDLWGFAMGYAHITVGVTAQNPDVPAYLWIEAPESNTTVKFVSWNTDKPSESLFAVPDECNTADAIFATASESLPYTESAAASCVSRATMIARAKVWVKNKVPYNQKATYQGYREDCSGLVSMAWGTSKPGYTTRNMNEVARAISKSALQPGDALLCAGSHVLLFGGWSGTGQTHYMAYEETRPGVGTVGRVTPYPYWYNTACFKPVRYTKAC